MSVFPSSKLLQSSTVGISPSTVLDTFPPIDSGSRIVSTAARLGALLLLDACLLETLSGEHTVVFDLELFAVARQLVALLGPRPKVGNGEAVVEVRAKVVHDANGKHDIHAELIVSSKSALGEPQGQGPPGTTRKLGSYLEHLQIQTSHLAV